MNVLSIGSALRCSLLVPSFYLHFFFILCCVIQLLSCILTLWPHGLQHARLPCPSLFSGVYSSSCLLNWWCHPIISSFIVPFFSCPQSFPASESILRVRWPKYWSFSFSICPSDEYPRLISFRIYWFDLLSVQGTLKNPPPPQFESINSLTLSLLSGPTFTFGTWLLEKPLALTRQTFVSKVRSLLFNTPSRFIIAFFPASKHLLIWWLQWCAIPWDRFSRVGRPERSVSLNPRQAEPFPNFVPLCHYKLRLILKSHTVLYYCISLLSQSSHQVTVPLALGNPGYFDRSFATWKNPYVFLITRQVTHSDLLIIASLLRLSPNNDNVNCHKGINNSLASANFVLSVLYLSLNPHNNPER